MKPGIMRCMFILLTLAWLLLIPSKVRAHEPHNCPEGFPDSPVLWGHIQQAQIVNGELSFDQIFDAGNALFKAAFNICDGQGRPGTTGTGESRTADEPSFIRSSAPESNSCAGCHNQPRAGGGGDFVANVFVLAQALDPVTDSLSPEFSNERNTLGMFGAGPIEMLSREMSAELHAIREAAVMEAIQRDVRITRSLEAKGVNFGEISALPDGSIDTSRVEGVDADLIIKPFHQAGVVVSIREFTANAMNHHHGMQAEERFDLYPGKGLDYDQDGISSELTLGDVTAITIFQAALAIPGRVLPVDQAQREIVDMGENLFDRIGCTSCHVPEMELDSRIFEEPNPFNPSGTLNDTGLSFSFDMTKFGEKPRPEKTSNGGAILRPYTDLKRHNLCDDPGHPTPIRFYCNEQLAQGRPDEGNKPGVEFFITRKLWDVGNSAPYGHRGDLTTITEAILAHGGEARAQRDAFAYLSIEAQKAVVRFLKTLQVLPEGSPRVIVGSHGEVQSPLVSKSPFLVWGFFAIVIFGLIKPLGWLRKSPGLSGDRALDNMK